MKGLKKCFGLLLLFFITLGLSLSASSVVNALEYTISSIPLGYPMLNSRYPNFYQFDYGFNITTNPEVTFNDFLANDHIISYARNNDSICDYRSVQGARFYYNLPYQSTSSTSYQVWNYSFASLDPHQSASTSCLFSDKMPSNTIFPPYSTWTLPGSPVGQAVAFNSLKPYRYDYNGLYISDSQKDKDGFVSNSKLDFIGDFFLHDHYPTEVKGLSIPFGSGPESLTFSSGQHVNFKGELWYSTNPNSPTLLDLSTSSAKLESKLFSLGGGSSSGLGVSTCSLDSYHQETDVPGLYSIFYDCSYDIPTFDSSLDFPWFRLILDFKYQDSNVSFDSLVYESSILITDYDTTPGGEFTEAVNGANPNKAPGSALQHDRDEDSVSFIDSLTDLFNFNFLNPFAPLYGLFTDQSDCVDISTLAGMLNSTETEYCPWFSADIRNILTPVIGLLSSLFLFGFLVHWLGSSSGNMIEDSAHETLAPPGASGHWGRRKK